MKATLAGAFLTGMLVLAANTTAPAADNEEGNPPASGEDSSTESTSPQPQPVAPSGSAVSAASLTGRGESGDGPAADDDAAAPAAVPAADPGSKCDEFPQMCSSQ
jgi:hypothetical protein